MIVLALAFAAGILTIVSPCTLPVLPFVVGSALGPNRGVRIATTVIGFGGAFVVVTVALAATLAASGLDLASVRVLAAIILGVAGLSMAVPAIERALDRWLSPIAAWAGQHLPRGGANGRARAATTGFATGTLLGLIWAPCVGPLMASVIATAVVQGPTIDGLLVALAYVAGAAVSLAAVAVGAGRFRLPGARHVAARARRFAGLSAVLAAVLIVGGLDARIGVGLTLQPDALLQPLANGGPDDVTKPRDLGPAPELTGITAWINTDPTSLAAHRGEVILVHFWTFGCSNCQAVQPYVKTWYARYRDAGFTVLSVHTPELSFERDVDNVRTAVAAKGVEYPVAFDPDFATWRAYGNQYWPAFYFIDKQGHVRHVHFGEGDYAGSEAVIQALLAEPA